MKSAIVIGLIIGIMGYFVGMGIIVVCDDIGKNLSVCRKTEQTDWGTTSASKAHKAADNYNHPKSSNPAM